MNKIDTSQIVDPNVEQPFLGTSLAFLQAAFKDGLANAVINMIVFQCGVYDPTKVYILYGCVVTGVTVGPGTCSMTAGAVFYAGEVYLVDSSSGSVASGSTVYSQLITTNPSPDPVTFSDGSAKNVHDVRKWMVFNLTTGTGTLPVSGWVRIDDPFHNVGTAGEPAFQNSWALGSGGAMAFVRRGMMVYMFGDVTNAGNCLTKVFTLPVGYRPPVNANLISQEVDPATEVQHNGYVDTAGGVFVAQSVAQSNKRYQFCWAFPVF